jgi:tripartite-type tricarboxylate transporter receptor subunit TctC
MYRTIARRALSVVLVALVTIVAVAVTALAHAASYPTRPIEIVVSYAAGGSTDFVARAIALKLQDRLGQSVVILNKPGASGTIGATYAAHADPDGYTLYEGYTSEMVVSPSLLKNVKYSVDDFEPIAVTGLVPVVLIASKNIHANTLPELIEELRASPGKYTYGGSVGAPSHILGAWMNRIKGLNTVHVPYKGGAQSVADVVGGHIDMFYAGVAVGKSAIDSGQVKAFAVTGDRRSAVLPNIPTFKEAGVTDFDLASWTVFMAPKGTPTDILALLRKETMDAISDPKIAAAMAAQGVEPSDTQDVKAFLANERAKFSRVVHELGISLEP